jgi:hypothetical protein
MVAFAAVQLAIILPILLAAIPAAAPAIAPPPRAAAAGGMALRRRERRAFLLLAVYFTTRAAITAAVAVHALVLLAGTGLTAGQAAFAAALIGPAQVFARLLDWRFARGLTPQAAALIGAALLPLAVGVLLLGRAAPAAAPLTAAALFALGYGMSNGLLTISRGTLPLHVFGPAGYATLLGRLALPSLLAQAALPTLLAPLIATAPAAVTLTAIGVAGTGAMLCLIAVKPIR